MNYFISKNKKNTKGFSLAETIIYISILSFILLVIASGLISFVNSEKYIKVEKNIESSAVTSLERITREIRNATSVDLSLSSFGTNPGSLKLNTTDENGNAKTVMFYVDNFVLKINDNDSVISPLTLSDSRVTNLTFHLLDNTNSTAVKIEMTIDSGQGEYEKSENFYSTIILRGSY